jgi:hypothetical protein
MSYYLKTDNGTTPPNYKHSNIEEAISEAKRLIGLKGATKVEILYIVGTIEYKEVPVVKKDFVCDIHPDFINRDDLPF